MMTSLRGNESLRAYINRIEYIIFLIETKKDEEKISTFLTDLREDLQKVLYKVQQKRYSKFQTRYLEHVYLPAIKEAQLNIYMRLGVADVYGRWVRQLSHTKMKLEWYLKVGENEYYADIT